MRRYLLAIAVILTVAPGCDNVAWGGVEVELMPPPTSGEAPPEDAPVEGESEALRVPGPLLLAGVRDGSRATLAVVGEITSDALSPFPDPGYPEDAQHLAERLTTGSEWILFAEGVRVGRLTADESGTLEDFCDARASVSGIVELRPEAGTAERLLALPAEEAGRREYGEYAALARDYDQGVATLNIAGEVIPRVGAPWPTEGTLAARQDIQAFQLTEVTGQAVAATFVHQDQLAVGPPRQGAYAVFVLGLPVGGAYQEAYSWYRSADTDGKGIPRYFGHLDWDGDGDSEILLDVLGADRRWHAALEQQGGEWVRTFQDACGSGSFPGE